MDLSFANQALGVEWLSQHHEELTPQVYEIPLEIDREVARLKLATMGIAIDRPTAEQEAYAASWQSGT
jgi:adenosylhomocysteinase